MSGEFWSLFGIPFIVSELNFSAESLEDFPQKNPPLTNKWRQTFPLDFTLLLHIYKLHIKTAKGKQIQLNKLSDITGIIIESV